MQNDIKVEILFTHSQVNNWICNSLSYPLFCFCCIFYCRDHFVYALSQWETMLKCNVVSHWLCSYIKWSSYYNNWCIFSESLYCFIMSTSYMVQVSITLMIFPPQFKFDGHFILLSWLFSFFIVGIIYAIIHYTITCFYVKCLNWVLS